MENRIRKMIFILHLNYLDKRWQKFIPWLMTICCPSFTHSDVFNSPSLPVSPSNLLYSRRTGIVWCLPILLSYLHLVIYFRFKLSFIILLFVWIWISWPPLPSLLPCRSSRSPPSSRAGKPWTRTRTKEKPQNQKQEQEQEQKLKIKNFKSKNITRIRVMA